LRPTSLPRFGYPADGAYDARNVRLLHHLFRVDAPQCLSSCFFELKRKRKAAVRAVELVREHVQADDASSYQGDSEDDMIAYNPPNYQEDSDEDSEQSGVESGVGREDSMYEY